MTQNCAWLTETVRFSLLGVQDGAKVTWHSLMGTDAETMTNRPAQQLTIEEGPCGAGRLVITTQPNRIDITLSAMPVDPVTPPTLGDFNDVSLNFEHLLAAIKMPTASRLAVGVVLNTFLDSQAQSGEVFKTLVPDVSLSPGLTDLVVQFNRPIKLNKISGIILNRLSKWSQLLSQTIQYQSNKAITKNHHLIQLEMDINTQPESTLPAASSYGSILTAMLNNAREIASGVPHG